MTDAELLEEERKKKEAAAMGEVQPQKPITFRDYNVPESPRASGLSVFTPSGEVKPGVDVSAITSAPETLPEPSEVNTALNQEVQVDSVNKPGLVDFFFGAPTPKQAQKILETQPTSPSQRKNLQAIVGGEESPSSVSKGFDYLFGRPDVPGDPNILGSSAQAATGASASEATPSVTPTIESPSGDAQGQAEAVPQGTFSTTRPSIDPSITAPISAEDFANLPVPEGTPAPVVIQGANGTGYQQAPEGMVKAMSPDGKMVFATPEQAAKMNQSYAAENTQNAQAQKDFLASDAMREFSNRQIKAVQNSTYSQESAAREQRLADRPDFGTAVSDRDRRAARGEGISMADAVDLAGGNRKEARAMIIRQRQGLDPMTGKPTEAKDTRTPEQIESDRLAIEAQELQNERSRQIIAKGKEPDATAAENKAASMAQAVQDVTITQAQADDANKRDLLGSPPAGYDTWAQAEAAEGQDLDGDGKVSTEAEASQATSTEFTPRQESGIKKVMSDNGITRDEAIKALTKAGKLK